MSVTAPQGFMAGGVACGIKEGSIPDLALVDAGVPVSTAAVFTRNLAAAPPVTLSRRHAADGSVRAVVLSSGCANAATGEQGAAVALAMAELVADRLGCRSDEVLVCSTGPIGGVVPIDKVVAGLGQLELSPDGGTKAAEAILTTDSHAKEVVHRADGYSVGGMAKGAGMIRPDMATMLAVVTTDAVSEPGVLDQCLRQAVGRTFNALNVDGCESTNDTVILMASGASGVTPDPADLAASVEAVCRGLSLQMAEDAEGASKVVTIELHGANDDGDALQLARSVADSALVRSSFYGADPNWGRVMAALGAAGVPFQPLGVAIAYGGVEVARNGVEVPADHDAISETLGGDFTVTVNVGSGPGRCSLLTTDLTPDYVRFNGERS